MSEASDLQNESLSDATTTTAKTTESNDPTWQRWLRQSESKLVDWMEWANPILVKETRQAIKSRQFLLTFAIVLVACWIVSFAGRALIGPQIFYVAAGDEMLIAYYAILAFPLMVIVPFTAFRSLSAEREDQTYDLLSITTLSSQQIISGKLGSAMLQILLYASAVSPCIAFTFLLRGVDLVTVALILGLTVLASIGLAMIGLMAGTLARVRYTQMLVSVALILSLAGVFVSSIGLAYEFTRDSYLFIKNWEFWATLAGLLTLYVTTFGLLRAAAAAQISFPSENRSTPLRWWMLVQQACFLGWMTVPPALYPRHTDGVPIFCMFAGLGCAIYWFVMGSLMTGEWPHLSRRVQRSLPQSSLGRSVLSWLNPGPASGYMFAITNLGMVACVAALVVWLYDANGTRGPTDEQVLYALLFSWCYVVIFLGLGRMVITAFRRFAYVPLPAAFLLHVILVLIAVGVPAVIHASSDRYRSQDYSMLQVGNPFWTIGRLLNNGPASVEAETLLFLLPTAALIVLLLNLRAVGAELNRYRILAPARVLEDERAQQPADKPLPQSPWDGETPEDVGVATEQP